MSAEGEFVDRSTLSAQVEDSDLTLTSAISRESGMSVKDLRIRDTPVVSRLWIWFVLAVAVAASRTSSHICFCKVSKVSEWAHPPAERLIHRFHTERRFETWPGRTHNTLGSRVELSGCARDRGGERTDVFIR